MEKEVLCQNTALKMTKNILLSVMTAISFCIDFSADVEKGFPTGRFLLLILSFSAVYYFADKHDDSRGLPLLSVFISFLWLLSVSYIKTAGLELIICQKLKAGVYFAGMTVCVNRFFKLLHFFLRNNSCTGSNNKQHWGKFFVLILLAYLPQIVICYPGYSCVDSQNQIGQYFGFWPMSSHHPVVSTYLMGLCVNAGISFLDNANSGLFFYVLLQYVIMSAVMAYALSEMKNSYKSPNWFIVISFLVIAVSPYFTNYVCTVVKDTLYSAFSVLFLIELLHMLSFTDEFFSSNRHRILMALATVGIVFFRNNGEYVVLIMLLVIAVFLAKRRKLQNIGFVFFPVIISIVICFAINSDSRIEKGSLREVLPFFIQQTARYAVCNPDDVTENERVVLGGVCDYEILPQRYNPMISDAAKDCFRYDISKMDVISYLRVWAAQGFRHPATYFGAFLNQNFALVYPFYPNILLFNRTVYENQYEKSFEILGISNFEHFARLQDVVSNTNVVLLTCPVVGLLSNLAAYILVFIAILFYSIKEKQNAVITASAFFLIQIAMIAAGPTLIWGARYGFPVFYSMPVFMAFSKWHISKEKGTAK